jgi:hypothetical protein
MRFEIVSLPLRIASCLMTFSCESSFIAQHRPFRRFERPEKKIFAPKKFRENRVIRQLTINILPQNILAYIS